LRALVRWQVGITLHIHWPVMASFAGGVYIGFVSRNRLRLRSPVQPKGTKVMSFLKKLFGGGSANAEEEAQPVAGKEIEHKGFTIRATPFKAEGQFQCCGVVVKEIDGVVKEHRFIRADRFVSVDDAADIALRKGQQLVDEQGERIFG
jgi:hypothetical protein